jgi:hypothetical protein
MRGRTPTLIGLSALAATAIAACGSSSDTTWSHVTKVTVLAQTAGVPPAPGGGPTPVVFSSPQQLKTVTAALNANHIHEGSNQTENGCAGGQQIAIVITQRGGKKTKLGAYRCAGSTTGDVGGNLAGFMKQIGVTI